MCFDGGALARAQYARANFRISPELFVFFGVRSFIADKGVVLVFLILLNVPTGFSRGEKKIVFCLLSALQLFVSLRISYLYYGNNFAFNVRYSFTRLSGLL